MKIEDAKKIPITKLVEHLGGRYSHPTRKGELWYFSPFRPEERTASFKVDEQKNTWHDFGLSSTVGHQKQSSGGDILDLWCDYHFKDRRSGIKEALAALESMSVVAIRGERLPREQGVNKPNSQVSTPRYKILKIDERIRFAGLKDELVRRRIDLKLADLYLKQGQILDTETNRKYTGFLFENDKGGYEVSIPNPQRGENFKTCIGPKATTRLLTQKEDTNSADVFEGFWDFLTWLQLKGKLHPTNHSYILNTTSLVGEVCQKIEAFKGQVGYVFLFMDNDEAGYQATHAIAGELERDFQVASWEQFYNGFKDLNEFWVKKALNNKL